MTVKYLRRCLCAILLVAGLSSRVQAVPTYPDYSIVTAVNLGEGSEKTFSNQGMTYKATNAHHYPLYLGGTILVQVTAPNKEVYISWKCSSASGKVIVTEYPNDPRTSTATSGACSLTARTSWSWVCDPLHSTTIWLLVHWEPSSSNYNVTYSNTVSIHFGTAAYDGKPAAPTLQIPTYGTNANANYITLTWGKASGAKGYNLYRSTSTTRPTTPFKKNATSPYYDYATTSGLVPGTKYYYWVEAYNDVGSSFSNRDYGNILKTTADSGGGQGGSHDGGGSSSNLPNGSSAPSGGLAVNGATSASAVAASAHAATTEAAPVDKAAAEYNGFLKDAAGKVSGSIQLKLAKAGKDGTSKVTGTVQLGPKKEKVTGTYKDGVLTVNGFSNVVLDKNGITGSYGAYAVDGSRNVFTAKDATSKASATAAMKAYKGAYTVAWQEGGVWGGVTVTVGNKGKSKATGFLPNGTKVGADGQLMLGEGTACVTLVSKNKKTPLAFNLWLAGGAAVVDGLGSDTHAAKVGALASGKSFTCSLLGNPVPVTAAGKKWSVTTDKATALKLTFTAKAGSFKGSFKNGKAKVIVNGVVVNGVGFGSAIIKKGAKAGVTIE